MSIHSTPYDFGGAETDGGLTDAGPTDEDTTVIVDGAAMTFRDYRRRGG